MSIIFTIFAGRKRYLSILIKYLDILLIRNIITDVHIWNYAKTEDDSSFIKTLSDKYTILTPEILTNGWYEYYDYYINSDFKDDDILIKCDDDIVYIDIDNFKKYLNNINLSDENDRNLYYPNIINNDVCAHIQSLNGVHSLLPKVDENLKQDGCQIPLSTWCGWFTKTELADKIHNEFLNDKEKFILNIPNIKWNSRVSINMFAGNFKTIKESFEIFKKIGNNDDETFMSARRCLIENHNNIIVPYCTVVHFSFNPQLTQDLDDKYLHKYDRLI